MVEEPKGGELYWTTAAFSRDLAYGVRAHAPWYVVVTGGDETAIGRPLYWVSSFARDAANADDDLEETARARPDQLFKTELEAWLAYADVLVFSHLERSRRHDEAMAAAAARVAQLGGPSAY